MTHGSKKKLQLLHILHSVKMKVKIQPIKNETVNLFLKGIFVGMNTCRR